MRQRSWVYDQQGLVAMMVRSLQRHTMRSAVALLVCSGVGSCGPSATMTKQPSDACDRAAVATPREASERRCPPGTRADTTRPMPPPSRAALNSSGANDDLIGDFETTLDEYTARSAGEIGHKYWCIRDGGIDHGPYHETYPGGAAALVGQFRDGEFHGTWTRWTEDGQLRAYEVYDGGELLRHGTCRGSPSPDFK